MLTSALMFAHAQQQQQRTWTVQVFVFGGAPVARTVPCASGNWGSVYVRMPPSSLTFLQ